MPATFSPAGPNSELTRMFFGSAPMAIWNPALAMAVPTAVLTPSSAAITAPTPGMRKLAPALIIRLNSGVRSLELMPLV